MTWQTFIRIIAAGYLIWWLLKKWPGQKKKTKKQTNFSRLKGACLGNEAQARRLIDYEYGKNPNLSESAAARNALDRLERDRR